MEGITLLPGMVFSHDWFTYNIPQLSETLAEFSGRDGLSFLEIGCFEGLSSVWFLQTVLTGSGSTITCIDTFKGSEEMADLGITHDALLSTFKRNVESFGDRVRIIDSTSGVALRGMPPLEVFDVVYVDGSHETMHVLEDAVLSWPLLKTGGIMVFDDYQWQIEESRPGPAIDAFLAAYTGHYELLHKEYQVALRKR